MTLTASGAERVLFLNVLLLACITMNGQLKKAETAHFKVRYEAEAEKYVNASLDVLESTWSIAEENGFHPPGKIRFSVFRSDRNVLYFNRKSLKGITWEYNSMENFLPPERSRKKNIYGLCHEMGHLCMHNANHNRNNWMSLDYREAWADYFGNLVIDSIYDRLGTGFWPEPHDYMEFSGMDFFLERTGQDQPELNTFNRAGIFWYELSGMIGFDRFHTLFRALEKEKVRNPGAKEAYMKILSGFIEESRVREWFPQYAEILILEDE